MKIYLGLLGSLKCKTSNPQMKNHVVEFLN